MSDDRGRERISKTKWHRRHPQGMFDPAGYASHTQHCGFDPWAGGGAPGRNSGIPLKPVCLKITQNKSLRAQDSLRPSGNQEPRSHTQYNANGGQNRHKTTTETLLLSLERLPNCVRDDTTSHKPGKDLDRLPDEQWWLDKHIQEKKLLIQEKLFRTQETLRKIQQERLERGEREKGKERRDTGMAPPEQHRTRTLRKVRTTHKVTWGRQTPPEPGREGGAEGDADRGKRADAGRDGREKEDSGQKELRRRGRNSGEESQRHKDGAKHAQNNGSEDEIKSSAEERRGRPNKQIEYEESRGLSVEERGRHRSTSRRVAGSHGDKLKSAPSSADSGPPRVPREEPLSEEHTDARLELLPCQICSRTFAAKRLEKHRRICEKARQKTQHVFDSFGNRTRGTQLQAFLKINGRTQSPEVKKSDKTTKHEAFVPGRVAEPSAQNGPGGVTCPHCSRRFASGPAERHIPKCQSIRGHPPPMRYR